jgi:DNA-binding CsgD family transcriptional regulator
MDIAKRAAEIYAEYKSIKQAAKILNVSEQTVKRLLISQGLFESELTLRISRLRGEGKTDEQIASSLGIGVNAVLANSPYTKWTYKGEEKSINAQRIAECRKRKTERE